MATLKEQISGRDIDLITNPDDFGTTATFGGKSVPVQFWDESEAATLFGVEVGTAAPFLCGKASDFPGVKRNDVITIEGVSYYALKVETDGFSLKTIHLSKDPG